MTKENPIRNRKKPNRIFILASQFSETKSFKKALTKAALDVIIYSPR